MPIETATHIAGLVEANPSGTETKSEGDDHIRLTKFCVRNTLPNFNTTVTITSDDLNNLPADIAQIQADLSTLDTKVDDNYTALQTQISTGDDAILASAQNYADSGDTTTLASANSYTDTRETSINAKIEADVAALENGQVATNTSNIATNTSNIAANTSGVSGLDSRLTTVEGVIDDINAGDGNYDAAKAYTDSEIAKLKSGEIADNRADINKNIQDIVNLEFVNGAQDSEIVAIQEQLANSTLTTAQVNDMINTAIQNLLADIFPINSYFIGSGLMRNSESPALQALPGTWQELTSELTHTTTNQGDTIENSAPHYGTFYKNANYNVSATGVNYDFSYMSRRRWRIWRRTG